MKMMIYINSILFLILLINKSILVLGFEKYVNELIKMKQGGYEKLYESDSNEKHEIIFCIKQRNREYIEKLLYDVSSPKSSSYGKHLSREAIADITSNPIATNAVKDYLQSKNIDYISTTYGEYIKATATIETWEDILKIKFYKYYNDDEGRFIHRSNYEAEVPSELKDHVQHLFKTNEFPLPNHNKALISKTSQSNVGTPNFPSCDGTVNIACLQEYYEINPTINKYFGNSTIRQAVYEYNQTFSMEDLNTFQKQQNVTEKPVTEVSCDGTITYGSATSTCAYTGECENADYCVEANLDVQYIMGIAQNVSTTVLFVPGDETWEDFILSLADNLNPPDVVSISYGGPESLVSSKQMYTFDYEAIKLGIYGTSIIVSSGDDGANGQFARISSVFCGYNPVFPASSPWVTAVGATQFNANGDEVACQGDLGGIITSGGGFSNVYSTPGYQIGAVTDFFKNLTSIPYPGYSINGRGYPDVALLGFNYTIVVGGENVLVSGTSASAPVFAAMISLINSNRKANDSTKSVLGFLNPLLYEVIALDAKEFIFNPARPGDVISGNNKCTAVGQVCCSQGFSAGENWDPVTGLGSVNFTHFNNYLVKFDPDPTRDTVSPTSAPTPSTHKSPSSPPTPSPVAEVKGYFAYLAVYENDQCSGQPPHVTAFHTEICYYLHSGLYAQFSCEVAPQASFFNGSTLIFTEDEAYYAQAALYTDSSCDFGKSYNNYSLSFDFNFGCSKTLISGNYVSSQFLCTNASSYNTAYPFDTTNRQTYSVLEAFFGVTCNFDSNSNDISDEVVVGSGFLNGYCFNKGTLLYDYFLDTIFNGNWPSFFGSFQFSSSKITVFGDSACNLLGISYPLNTECKNYEITDDAYNFFFGYLWTTYPYSNNDSRNRLLSPGIIVLIVILVVGAAGTAAFFAYRKMLFNRQLASALSLPINAPVQTTVVRIQTPTTSVIATHDTVPNPMLQQDNLATASPVNNNNVVVRPLSTSAVARY